jgi:hypothetical protein
MMILKYGARMPQLVYTLHMRLIPGYPEWWWKGCLH